MAYEAYVSLVVIPEEARHRAPWDSQRPANGTTYTQDTSGVSCDDLFLSGVKRAALGVDLARLPQLVGAVPARRARPGFCRCAGARLGSAAARGRVSLIIKLVYLVFDRDDCTELSRRDARGRRVEPRDR